GNRDDIGQRPFGPVVPEQGHGSQQQHDIKAHQHRQAQQVAAQGRRSGRHAHAAFRRSSQRSLPFNAITATTGRTMNSVVAVSSATRPAALPMARRMIEPAQHKAFAMVAIGQAPLQLCQGPLTNPGRMSSGIDMNARITNGYGRIAILTLAHYIARMAQASTTTTATTARTSPGRSVAFGVAR